MSPVRSVTYVSGPDLDSIGGADGVRTHDLLDAIEARSQLRHGPTELFQFTTGRFLSSPRTLAARPPCNPRPALQVLLNESKLFTEYVYSNMNSFAKIVLQFFCQKRN